MWEVILQLMVSPSLKSLAGPISHLSLSLLTCCCAETYFNNFFLYYTYQIIFFSSHTSAVSIMLCLLTCCSHLILLDIFNVSKMVAELIWINAWMIDKWVGLSLLFTYLEVKCSKPMAKFSMHCVVLHAQSWLVKCYCFCLFSSFKVFLRSLGSSVKS